MLNVSLLRRYGVLVLVTVASPFVSAFPQPATLAFSHPELSGSFGVRIESTTQVLIGITSVSLTIENYKFKLKDIGFRHEAVGDYTFIAGLPHGLDVVSGATASDFFLVWTPSVTTGYAAFISYTSGTDVIQIKVDLTITPRKPQKMSVHQPSFQAGGVSSSSPVLDSPIGVFALRPARGTSLIGARRQRIDC